MTLVFEQGMGPVTMGSGMTGPGLNSMPHGVTSPRALNDKGR